MPARRIGAGGRGGSGSMETLRAGRGGERGGGDMWTGDSTVLPFPLSS